MLKVTFEEVLGGGLLPDPTWFVRMMREVNKEIDALVDSSRTSKKHHVDVTKLVGCNRVEATTKSR